MIFIKRISVYVEKVNQKKPCENYPFEGYHLKSGITTWILGLRTSARSPRLKHDQIGSFFSGFRGQILAVGFEEGRQAEPSILTNWNVKGEEGRRNRDSRRLAGNGAVHSLNNIFQ
jgi:hypothetical protein